MSSTSPDVFAGFVGHEVVVTNHYVVDVLHFERNVLKPLYAIDTKLKANRVVICVFESLV